MQDDRIIAAAPHPEGSLAAEAVRNAVFARMRALGLSPRRLPGEAVEAPPAAQGLYASGGRVENLIGLLPGTDPHAKGVLLMAHSDSVPGSPGAADDAAGVSCALEVVRAVEAQGPRLRPLVVLITDGEEMGLLGARSAFKGSDPALDRVGLVINMEARGGGGRVAMFETGARNGGDMSLFAHNVSDTDALSVMSEVYKHMPNSTDFTVAKAKGYRGFNFAFLGVPFDYHSPSSTTAVLDQGSLQHMGDQVLAVTTPLLSAATLPQAEPDAIYSDVLGGPVVVYSAGAAFGLLAATAVLALTALVLGLGFSGEGFRLAAVARAAVAVIAAPLVAALALHLAGRVLDQDAVGPRRLLAELAWVFPGLSALAVGLALWTWRVAFTGRGRFWLIAAVLASGLLCQLLPGAPDLPGLGLGAAAAVLTLSFSRPAAPWSAWAGVGLIGVCLCLLLLILAPPLSVIFAWPLGLGALTMALAALAGGGRWNARGALVLFALSGGLGAAYLGRLAALVLTAVGLQTPESLALIILIGPLVLLPLIEGWSQSRAALILSGALIGLGLLALGAAAVRSPWSGRTPQAVQAFYLEAPKERRAWRASAIQRLDPWARRVLQVGAAAPARVALPPFFSDVALTSAPFADLPAPEISLTATGGPAPRTLTLTLKPPAGAREFRLFMRPDRPIGDVTVEGLPSGLQPRPGAWAQLRWSGAQGPVVIRFKASGSGALDLGLQTVADGWPQGLSPPAKGVAAMPWGLSDDTVEIERRTLFW
jgi:hypothetical protein